MVGRVISGAFDAYGALFGVLIPVAAAIVTPYEAVLLALQLSADDTDRARNGLLVVDTLASMLLVLPLLVVVVTRAAEARERGQPPQVWRALREAVDLLVPIAGTQILLVLAVALLPGIVILAGLAANAPGLILAGLIALLGSAVLNGVRLSLALPVVLLEGLRYSRALRRSVELVRGSWTPVFLALLAVVGCALLLNLAATAAVLALTGNDGTAATIGQRAAAAATTILVTPFVALASLQLYRARLEAASGAE